MSSVAKEIIVLEKSLEKVLNFGSKHLTNRALMLPSQMG